MCLWTQTGAETITSALLGPQLASCWSWVSQPPKSWKPIPYDIYFIYNCIIKLGPVAFGGHTGCVSPRGGADISGCPAPGEQESGCNTQWRGREGSTNPALAAGLPEVTPMCTQVFYPNANENTAFAKLWLQSEPVQNGAEGTPEAGPRRTGTLGKCLQNK